MSAWDLCEADFELAGVGWEGTLFKLLLYIPVGKTHYLGADPRVQPYLAIPGKTFLCCLVPLSAVFLNIIGMWLKEGRLMLQVP